MKKLFGALVVSMVVISMSGIAQAGNTMVFDPSAYPEVPEVPAKTVKTTTTSAKTTATTTAQKETKGIKTIFTNKDEEKPINPALTQKETENFQNALLQLDSAQVEIRNTLLDKKTKYAEVDSNYKMVKQERDAMKKEVKEYEKRVKSIEKAKEKIRKSMI